MREVLKFGTAGRECPHCVGPQAFRNAHFSREEIQAQELLIGTVVNDPDKIVRRIHKEADKARENVRSYSALKLKGKIHEKEIKAALAHQARIAQLDHDGWDIEIHAWVNVCPDCDRVTEYRASPAHHMRFGWTGPIAESNSCTDCIQAKQKAALEAEMLRLSKMTTEEIEAERAAKERAATIITDEFLDAEIAKAVAAGGPTPMESARILRLMNRKGQPLGVELAK